MSGQSLWNLATGPDMAERPDMSSLGAGHVRGMPLESGLEAGHIRLPKLDSTITKSNTPVLTGRELRWI
jgi:hypothetical protein